MFRNGLEPWHLILVVLAFVLLFGSKRLPDAARGLGKSLRILKSETRALREDGADETPEPTAAAAAPSTAATAATAAPSTAATATMSTAPEVPAPQPAPAPQAEPVVNVEKRTA